MPTLTKVIPKSKKELHDIIEKEIDALEEELEVLRYEFVLRQGIADFLCVDNGGRLVIIEVKLKDDENILFQALKYYNEIDKERYTIAQRFSDIRRINPERHPRIILIAQRFSEYTRQRSTLVAPDVELYEYTVLSTADGQQGICYHSVFLPPAPPTTTSLPTEEIRNYITEDSLKPRFDHFRNEIKNIDKGIKEYTKQQYVGFKYRERHLAVLVPHQKAFDIGVAIIGEGACVLDCESIQIEPGAEDYSETIKKIRKSFEAISA